MRCNFFFARAPIFKPIFHQAANDKPPNHKQQATHRQVLFCVSSNLQTGFPPNHKRQATKPQTASDPQASLRTSLDRAPRMQVASGKQPCWQRARWWDANYQSANASIGQATERQRQRTSRQAVKCQRHNGLSNKQLNTPDKQPNPSGLPSKQPNTGDKQANATDLPTSSKTQRKRSLTSTARQ